MDISLVKDILTILAILIGALVSFFIYFNFSPVIEIKMIDSWIDNNLLILRIEIKNISKVRVPIVQNSLEDKGGGILFQIFEHDKNHVSNLTEFLPFTKEWFVRKKYPSEWKEPEIIFETTKWIYPNEVIAIERVIQCDSESILHIGVQVHARYKSYEVATFKNWTQRWTTVRFITKKICKN